MSRYISSKEKAQTREQAQIRLKEIEATLIAKLAEVGIVVSYISYPSRLQIWGDKVVEFRGGYNSGFSVREKKTKNGELSFDYAAVVKHILQQKVRQETYRKLEEAKEQKEQEFSAGLKAQVEAWASDTKGKLHCSPWDFTQRDRVEIKLQFCQEDAEKLQAVVEALAPILGFENPYRV